MNPLLVRRECPILQVDPAGPEWQRGSVFNPSVNRIGMGAWRMMFRATPTAEFGVAGRYASSIGVADSNDGLSWTIRETPLIVATMPEEHGLGCEDPRATVVAVDGDDPLTAVVKVFYNAVELRTGWKRPRVRIFHATVTNDYQDVEKHGVFLESGSPEDVRMKAAALFPGPLANGCWPLVFTFGTESPYGTLMYADHLTLDELKNGITKEDLANMFLNTREHNILLPPPSPVERGPEIGAPPIKVGDDYVMFYCPANQDAAKRWSIGALLLDGETRKPTGHLADILIPESDYEKQGVVDNVAFPSAAVFVEESDEARVFYGGADKSIYVGVGSMSDIVRELRKAPLAPVNWPY